MDASPYIFRAFHALPKSLVDSSDRPVNAAYGFLGFLIRLVAEENVERLGVAFDASLTTSYRNEIFPEYKAHRDPPPPELTDQVSVCRALAEAFGATVANRDGFEADDLVATWCRAARTEGRAVVIVSSDKDLCQLVDDWVELYDFGAGRHYGPPEVETKFGVPPSKLLDLLALQGDAVDNIPGVAGVGPKSASAILDGLGSLDAALDDPARIADLPIRGSKSLAAKIEAGAESARLSRRLAELAQVPDLALPTPWRGASARALPPLLEELGFRGVRDRIPRWTET